MTALGVNCVKETIKMFKKLSDKIHQFVGGWGYFFGSCMADGFEDRMQQIVEEEETTAENELFEEKRAGRRVN